MSSKQPVVTAKQITKAIEKKGFVFKRMTGSHAIYRNEENLRVVIPLHGKKNIGTGLLMQILKDANITIEELRDLI